jgi:hypothetical protein
MAKTGKARTPRKTSKKALAAAAAADPNEKLTIGKLVMKRSTIVRDLQAFDAGTLAGTKAQWYGKNADAARAALGQ